MLGQRFQLGKSSSILFLQEMSGYTVPEVKCHITKLDSYSSDTGETVPIDHFKNQVTLEEGKYYYGVQVVAGVQLEAGTTSRVFLNLIGSKAQTGTVQIQNLLDVIFGDRFSNSSSKSFVIVSEQDLGDVLVVTVSCAAWLIKDDLYVNFVAVGNLQTNAIGYFPCYHWLGRDSSVSITASTTTLKDVGDNKILLYQRTEQLRQHRELYRWRKFPESGIPSAIDDSTGNLPLDERFEVVKDIDFDSGGAKMLVRMGIEEGIPNLFKKSEVKELREYEELADVLGSTRPLYEAGRWATDVEFGRQMLNGVNPIVITKCTELPPNFPVNEEMVKPLLNRGLSLEEEMKNGAVYICDLKIMDGLEAREGYFNVAPICLLYVNGSGQLVPIAIQLKQGAREEEKGSNPIFLPTDNWIDWLRAKMFYQSAHSQLHQLYAHYVTCHATMEAYAMGIRRNLPDPHPIFKLLVPHTRYTMAINSRARATLINEGGTIDQIFGIGGAGKAELFRRVGKKYSVHISNIKRSTKERGVDIPEELPGYYYRDDGFKLWDALEEYAGGIINEFYQSDDDVKTDKELQHFAEDVHTNGFPGSDDVPDGHGFPRKITTRQELRELCTLIMFTGSAQHASVNFLQYYIYQYAPNAPSGVRHPPPAKKGEASYQDLLETLPDEDTNIKAIGTAYILSQYSQDEKYLGDYEPHFGEKGAIDLIEKLKSSLMAISNEIQQRNAALDMPYTGMLPEKVPNSITI